MEWTLFSALIALLVGLLVLKFLAGVAKTIVSVILVLLGAGVLLYFVTGFDPLGVEPTAAAVANTVDGTMIAVDKTVNATQTAASHVASSAKALESLSSRADAD